MELDRLLSPLSGESPSGMELRNDPRFHAIERMVEPAARENRLNPDGSFNNAGANVDWNAVMQDAQALAAEGRDLRLLTLLVRAHFNIGGVAALAEGLDMLTQSVVRYWDSLHPELRARDDARTAALPRLNALKQLENDDNGLLGDLRFGVLLNPRGIGPVTGDDLAAATLSDFEVLSRAASGLGQAEKDALVAAHGQRVNRVTAAARSFVAEEGDRAAEMMNGLAACETGIEALIAVVSDKGGFAGQPGLSLNELSAILGLCRKTLERAAAATAGEAAPVKDDPAAAPVPARATNGGAPPGAINSRAEVEACLDRIVGFYERTEPSSPIPHLARRMRRMVAMDFLELMEEIAPSGLKEFRSIAGVEEPKKK